MNYQFSTTLTFENDLIEGLCDQIPVRIHKFPHFEHAGTLEAQSDWQRMVGSLKDHEGGLGPTHGFMTLSVPECIPERLHIVSYANEFAFLYDDVIDLASEQDIHRENAYLLEAFVQGSEGRILDSKSGKRQMQAKILSNMLDIDRPRAMFAMKAWAKFIESSSGREHHTSFCTMEEYMPYRCKDVGHMFWHALIIFGCAFSIPEHEDVILAELVMPAVKAASLTNDLFSYDKEFLAAMVSNKPDVVNSVWVLMKEHRIPLDEAKDRCRNLIRKEVEVYRNTLRGLDNRTNISTEGKRYLELMQYSVSGNVVWSRSCARYHQHNGSGSMDIPQYPASIFQPANPHCYKRSLRESFTPPAPGPSPASAQGGLDSGRPAKQLKDSESDSPPTDDFIMQPSNEYTTQTSTPLSSESIDGCLMVIPLPKLSDHLVVEPFKYLNSMPSKGIRDKAIDAINKWLNIPETVIQVIKSVVSMLHSSSLMLDDLEDRSELRRGRPATHIIYGSAQTINSATFLYIQAVIAVQKLQASTAFDIFVEEVRCLFTGQSFDLHWTREMICPTVLEYLQMADGKTGSLFRLITRLMTISSARSPCLNLSHLTRILGRYFQIRDDYQNLASPEYAAQKGYCEDLDEGKFSLPLIHVLNNSSKGMLLKGLLHRRRSKGSLTREQKQTIIDEMNLCGSLAFTRNTLHSLYHDLEMEIEKLDKQFGGGPNFEIRFILSILKV
ncbi:isoprenoid synthase domain-containing protein [Dendryphion nanum]|uniref:geranylgeranyl diphosphate synthase n=1 Tax=Dendryphion nanum TaxID=256645 RepID=A0A9P9D0N4_9PLEO|nr:isoprenoid synthase domain-containing protein [Dendryphion nanum]